MRTPTERPPGETRRDSFSRLAISDGLIGFGALTSGAALIGSFAAPGDSVVMLSVACVALGIGVAGRRTFVYRRRVPAGRVISGLASTWVVLVVAGTVVYLTSGAITTLDGALFESAAGFSTVALTTIDPAELSLPLALFRGSTQWLGGAVGLIAGAVALPATMKGNVQIPKGLGRRIDRLSPTPQVGRRRVLAIYATLTTLCGLGYWATGMSGRSSAVHAMTTLSTGGMSDSLSSFSGAGVGSRAVATAFMIVAGMSYFAIWWLLRGNTRRFWRSPELRTYGAIIAVTSLVVVWAADDLSFADALFTAASASSTTGHAVTDWTLFPASALSVLLIAVATGAMGASAGSGLRVVRVHMLFAYVRRELRLQLDPYRASVVRHGGRTVTEAELGGLTGYQIAHFGLCGLGALFLASTGVDLLDSIWAAVSVVSTAGPSPATTAFGNADQLGRYAQLLLIPGMLAGRLTILPLLLAVVSVLRLKQGLALVVKRTVAERAVRSRL